MKKFAIAAVMAVCALGASAQDVSFESSDNNPFLGLRLGLDISCPSDLKFKNVNDVDGSTLSLPMFDNGAGFDLGVVYNIPVWKNLYFEPGVSLYYNTMGFNTTYVDAELPPELGVSKLEGSVRRFGLRVPMVMGYSADWGSMRLSLFTGPVFSLGLYGRNHLSAKISNATVTESENCYNDDASISLNRFDVGWKIGAGVTYQNFVVQLSGTIGMCDMYKSGDGGKYHDNNVALTVGYNFAL